MKTVTKYIAAAFLGVAIFGCIGSAVVAAETEVKEIVMSETVQVDMSEFPTNDELFAGYVENVLYDGLYEDAATYGNMGEIRLPNEESKTVYRLMKQKVAQIADGECETAEMYFEKSFTWTLAELGADINASLNERLGRIDYNAIIRYLLMDCPYDMYWYDKTVGCKDISYDYNISKEGISIDIAMKMSVATEFGVEGGSLYDVNTQVTKSVITAKNKAQSIVNANKTASAYEKMCAYKEEICNLVSYNHEAADDDTTPYGNPWQLIWVFDEDESTKVVCEGYAKAFQYLCDLSDLTCYTVSGVMSSVTSGGGHMWNIVTLDGANYLVDVTNCDDGTIGAPNKLFLVGTANGNVTDGYTFKLGYDVSFIYDSNQILLLGEDVLDLATENYSVKESEPTTPVTEIFEDVSDGDWFADEVQYVYDKGIMTGISDTLFDPNTAVTRATIVQTLYKLEGKPVVNDFTKYDSLDDTLDSIWWRNGLAWALNEGVAKGDSKNNVFNPNNEVTREDLATFIYRYAQYKGVNVELEGTEAEILGDTFVNSWARSAFAWAIESGLIKGKTINGVSDLAPQVGATRAELATIMMRFYQNHDL